MKSPSVWMPVLAVVWLMLDAAEAPAAGLRDEALTAMKRAATYYREQVARHGGYVYYTSPDLARRWGEGVGAPDQIWVQSPGTPDVGLAYLAAWKASGDEFYRDAAREAAHALVYGQLASGGWTNSISFDPQSKNAAQYRNGRGKGRNYSTLDDGITQTALRFLMRMDQALEFHDAEIHESVKVGLDALLAAQFPNGAFPQVWNGPVAPQAIRPAQFPDYDWRTENRIKNYWDLYTLNDGVAGQVSDTLLEALDIYQDDRCRAALVKLGDFLILAQMPAPQPAWAQQYDYEMRPVWARKFEPPAITGGESQDAISTLLKIHRLTDDAKYLAPIPRALAYLRSSRLPDGRLARYYELQSNRPLYMTDDYQLTYDDRNVPSHYGWKRDSQLDELQRAYNDALVGRATKPAVHQLALEKQVRQIISALDNEGRWISHSDGQMLVGQPKFKLGEPYLSSTVFNANLRMLSEYLAAGK